jgi:IS30 family transposase
MRQRPRIYYSDGQKAPMWERWRQGDSLQKIDKDSR